MTFLRQTLTREEVNRVWRAVYEDAHPADVRCPSCRNETWRVIIRLRSGPVELDACRNCQLVWFDGPEFERFTPDPVATEPKTQLALEVREAIGRAELASLDRRRSEESAVQGPDELWKVLPAALGFPVEQGTPLRERYPWATWVLTALVWIVSMAAMIRPEVGDLPAWIPAEPTRLGGATLLTSFFVHAGPLHLLGNLYFFVVFGDDVEDLIGSGWFLALLLAAELAAAVGHLLLSSDPTIPCVGSSGGISGILAYHAVRLPHKRLSVLILYSRWLAIPAWLAFVAWLLLQGWGAALQVHGLTDVSAGAHLGGAAVGLALGFITRR